MIPGLSASGAEKNYGNGQSSYESENRTRPKGFGAAIVARTCIET